MKAMVLRKLGGRLELADVPIPRIGPNDALLRVRATGVGLTVVIMVGVPGRVTSFPRIPGHEVAGDVVEVGSEVTNVRPGDRVATISRNRDSPSSKKCSPTSWVTGPRFPEPSAVATISAASSGTNRQASKAAPMPRPLATSSSSVVNSST